jgi:hypothetical protein
MFRVRVVGSILGIFSLSLALHADAHLTDDQLKMLQDPQGWEYIALLDQDNGIPMKHDCFVQNQPGAGGCRGTLVFTTDHQFTQKVFAHGGVLDRHGTYELNGDQITLKDELGTSDGPYQVQLNPDKKSLEISMRQAGVLVGADLLLESEYQKAKEKAKGPKPGQ